MKDIALSLIQYSSWPIALLVCLFVLRVQIISFIERLRGFKAGSIELQLQEQLHAQGLNDDQMKLVASLSADEIDLFLLMSFTENLGFEYTTPIPREIFIQRARRLEEVGLLTILNPNELADPNSVAVVRHNQTPLGRRLRALLLNSSAQLLSGLK